MSGLVLCGYELSGDRQHYFKSGNDDYDYDLHEIQLTQKEAFLERRYLTENMLLLTPYIVLGHVVVLRPSPLPQCLRNEEEKLTQEGRNVTS